MNAIKNHKFLTVLFILIGVGAFVFSFFVFQQVAFDSQKQIKNALTGSKASESSLVLPDIKRNEQVTQSKVRDAEVSKVKTSLPYYEPSGKFSIIYYNSTKVLQVEINANSISEYRERKQEAEAVLTDLGADNVCYLVALWAVPTALNREISSEDITTTGCPT